MENFFGRDEQQRKPVPPGTRRGHGELDIFKPVGANAPPYTGKLGGRDSIKTKIFEEEGRGLERGRGNFLESFPSPSPNVILLPFLKMPWLSPAPPEEAAEATLEGGRLGNREARPARDAKENRKGRAIPRHRGNLRPAGAPRRRDAPGSGGARPCGCGSRRA